MGPATGSFRKNWFMSRNIRLVLLIAACFYFSPAKAARVDTVSTFSAAMNKNIKAIVITPDSYSKARKFPVVYLLHGADGDYSNWILKVPEIAAFADQYQQIIVCPDGGVTSWYFDSPVNPAWKYETYIVGELVPWVDANYATITQRKGRAITGLSMGGHGALYLAFRHQDVFGAAGSMSGGVDIRPFPKNWKIEEKLGSYAQYPENWENNTVINMVHLLTPNRLTLIIDCGTDDFFYKANLNLHEKLLERNIPHDFIARPGIHDWSYWKNAVKYQMLFFGSYFKNN
jgi:S-formylglutathione hydrolase FrmB